MTATSADRLSQVPIASAAGSLVDVGSHDATILDMPIRGGQTYGRPPRDGLC